MSRVGVAALLAAALPAGQAAADAGACRSIAAPAARLACYDALMPPVAAPATAAPAASAPESGTAATAAASAGALAEQAFGAESLNRAHDPETEISTIESRLMAKVETFTKGARYRLENGQVWQITDDRERHAPVDHPRVTIKRNFIGNYWMQVEGWGPSIRVKRVQ